MKVPMVKPDLTSLEMDYAHKAICEGEIGVKSPYVREFEEKLAEYLGFKYVLYCNSGWSALLLAFRAAKEIKGIQGVVMPAFTMIATGTAAKQAGLDIRFMDVNERGMLEGKFSEAVCTVDIYGKMCEARSETFTIEDSAEIFGKKPYYGDVVCFSFFYNKILTTGNGGAVATNDEALYNEMKLLRHHYYDGHSYVHEKDGYNVSQSGALAAIGTKQLERADEILAKRRELGRRYVDEIGGWECEEYWYYPFMTASAQQKAELKQFLADNDIESRDFFNPIHRMPPFGDSRPMSVSDGLYEKGLLLPLYSAMTRQEQDYVIEKVKQFYEK